MYTFNAANCEKKKAHLLKGLTFGTPLLAKERRKRCCYACSCFYVLREREVLKVVRRVLVLKD